MIRNFHLADWLTLGNAICGVSALFAIMAYLQDGEVRQVLFACALIVLAFVFDVFDGRAARWRQKSSSMGRELDSLADVISFGVAPAVIAYGIGMNGLWDRVVLLYFVACGVSRLARYNVSAAAAVTGPTDKVKFYEGTPITFSIVPLAIVLGLASTGPLSSLRVAGLELHYATLLFLLSGSLMISKTLRIPKL